MHLEDGDPEESYRNLRVASWRPTSRELSKPVSSLLEAQERTVKIEVVGWKAR